jgi:uncharacterized protein
MIVAQSAHAVICTNSSNTYSFNLLICPKLSLSKRCNLGAVLTKEGGFMTDNDDRQGMSREEAGQKGGEATAREHGPEFYSEIGRKGGEAVSQDREHMADIGRKGGQSRQDGDEDDEEKAE